MRVSGLPRGEAAGGRTIGDGRGNARTGSSLRDRWARASLAAMPLLAIALLAMMIGALLWYLDRDERERARASLLTDALWVEQTLRFQLGIDEDALSRLALDSAMRTVDTETVMANARQLVANYPEVLSISWLDGEGTLRRAVPPTVDLPDNDLRMSLMQHASGGSIRPVYGAVRRQDYGMLVIDMASPVAGGAGRGGVVVATISVDALLARHVPWWIAEKYDVRLVDAGGNVIAAKSSVPRGDDGTGHAIAFDPPMPGVTLQIAPHRTTRISSNALLMLAVFGLALAAMVSLVLAHRHVRKRLDAESALFDEMAFRRAMEDSLTVGMRARDLEGRIIYVNSAFCRMLGVEPEDLIGRRPPMPYWNPDDLAHTITMHDRVLTGNASPQGFELKFRRADGSLLDVLIYEAPLIDARGRQTGWMASVLDITDRKRAEDLAKAQDQSLQRTARLVTMGEMASTLAHELNQPLAAIAGYGAGCLNLIRSNAVDPPALTEALEKLGTQAQRAGQIIRRVHDFVRKREPKISRTVVIPLIMESAAFAEAEARKHGARIELDLPEDLPDIAADRILMQQVLLNLIRNGIEAMVQTPRDARILTLAAACEDRTLRISVADRGTGIPAALRDRLFESFVTTKPDGMGMGLNICRSIVEFHKGHLSVEAREGGGTTFAVILPVLAVMELAS